MATANGFADYKTNYAYDKDDRIKQVQYGDTTHKVDYNYDSMGRISKRTVTNGSASCVSSYEYAPGGYGSSTVNSTSPLISKITQPGISFEYTYDECGNILSEKRGNLTTTYRYDALGQLVQVNDPHEDATWVYTYDRGGNIISKKRYALRGENEELGSVLETISYTYGDRNWKDKLTAYNGTTITYDAIGNPINDGTWTYTWTAGRQLAQMSKPDMTVQFKYNHEGLRTQKIVTENGVTTTTEYTYHGTLLTHMKKDTDEMHFFYDAQTRPTVVEWNGTKYHYLHNLQGDIVGIIDNTGTSVVEYKYDAWGKLLIPTGTMASTLGYVNPLLYRGYVFDTETNLYYLRSRYYNPKWDRFVNADNVYGCIGNITPANTYNYCFNVPCRLVDADGMWPKLGDVFAAIAVVACAVALVATTVATCGATTPLLVGAAGTFIGTTSASLLLIAEAATVTGVVATTVTAVATVYENVPRNYEVYGLKDPITQEVKYVGRTKNYEKRINAHHASGSWTYELVPAFRISNLTYIEARGLEELGMAYYHTRLFLHENGKNRIH